MLGADLIIFSNLLIERGKYMKQEYLIGAIVVTAITSIAGAAYAFVSSKKISDLEMKLEQRGNNIYRDVERRKDDILDATKKEISEINETLKKKVNGISDSLNVDIPDDIVEAALRKAADTEAQVRIAATSKKVIDEYSVALRSEVRKSVDLAYANTKVDVKNELTRQISNIDISGIKREIVNEAKEKVEEELEDSVKKIKDSFEEKLDKLIEGADEKLDDELDSISTRFSNDLERGSKIYKKLSDKLGDV